MPDQKFYTEVGRFPSKSQAGKEYVVKRDEHGNLSCDCPAWRFKKGASRTCQHVGEVSIFNCPICHRVMAIVEGEYVCLYHDCGKPQPPDPAPTEDVVAGLMGDIEKAKDTRGWKPLAQALQRLQEEEER